MRKGYKVVWRPEGAEVAESLNSDILPGASRQYEPDKPVEPAPGLGPLLVFGICDYEAAEKLAVRYARAVRKDRGCAEIWEVDWLLWESTLPMFRSEDGGAVDAVAWYPPLSDLKNIPNFEHKVVTRACLPVGTRLARQVILRRLMRRVRVDSESREVRWEKPDENN